MHCSIILNNPGCALQRLPASGRPSGRGALLTAYPGTGTRRPNPRTCARPGPPAAEPGPLSQPAGLISVLRRRPSPHSVLAAPASTIVALGADLGSAGWRFPSPGVAHYLRDWQPGFPHLYNRSWWWAAVCVTTPCPQCIIPSPLTSKMGFTSLSLSN